MVKLEAKPNQPKLSRQERLQRQKEREAELTSLLTIQQTSQDKLDVEDFLKVAQEGGEIQATDITQSDAKRLARLSRKANKSIERVQSQ